MAPLRLQLLGSPRVRHGEQVLSFPRQKALALLVYLACKPGPQPRGYLCALLWDDVNEATARQSLSTLLSTLRHAFGSHDNPGDDHLVTALEAVALVRHGDDWCDVDEFEATLRGLEHRDAALDAAAASLLEHTLDLYRGPFLDGLSLRDGAAFEDWALQQRTRWELLARDGLRSLVAYHERRGAYAQAREFAQRALALDDLDETMHATMLRLLVGSGHFGAAQRHYLNAIATLTRELGDVPPYVARLLRDELQHAETRTEHHEVSESPQTVASRTPASIDGASVEKSPLPPLVSAHSAFQESFAGPETALIGRNRELASLRDIMGVSASQPRPTLVVLEGAVGMGKTRLLREALSSMPRHLAVLALHARRLQQSVPYWPLLAALGQSIPAFADTGADPAQAVVPWARYLTDCMPRTLPTIVLDAAQWTDPWTLRVLDTMLSSLYGRPPLIILALRPDETTPELAALIDEWTVTGKVLRIMLPPLGVGDVSACLTDEPVDGKEAGPLATSLVGATGGRPDLLAATIAFLRRHAGLANARRLAGDHAAVDLPDEALTILRRHLAHLDPVARAVVETCAAQGGVTIPPAVHAASAQATAAAFDKLVGRRLLILESDEWGSRYRLAVPALCRVALEEMPPAQRALLLETVQVTS